MSQAEELLMAESNFYEELLIVEDELVDQYVRRQMSESDRADFENYFLKSLEHQQKLRFARALTRYVEHSALPGELGVERSPESNAFPLADTDGVIRRGTSAPRRFGFWPFQSPALNYALAAVLVIGMLGVGWMVLRGLQSTGPGRVFEATIFPGGLTREGGQIQTISIPPGTDTLRVDLTLAAEQYQDYKIELVASDGSSILTREQLKSTQDSGKRFLAIDIPANLLRADIYRIKLGGRTTGSYDSLPTYTFQITR